MGTSIQQFESEEFGTIRTTTIDGEPWFVAKDVCDALGLNRVQDSTRYLDEDERGMCLVNTPSGEQNMVTISEAGLYSLVLKSRKPEAKAFKRWVTHEVLPSIRKHGMYATPQTVDEMLADPDTMIRTLQALKAERQKNVALTEDNARMLPKAMAYDGFIDTDGTTTITQVARYLAQLDPRMTMKRLYALLRADGFICKADRTPTKLAINRGLAKQIMSTRKDGKTNEPYARLTQKGIDYCVSHYIAMPSQMKTI